MRKFSSLGLLVAFFICLGFLIPISQAATQKNLDPNASFRKTTNPLAEFEKVKKINNDLAIRHFTNLIETDPNGAVNYARRGKAHSGNRDYDKAGADYDKAIKLDPKLTDAYIGRAVIRLMKKDYENCWKDVHKVESLGGEFWPAFTEALKTGSGRDK